MSFLSIRDLVENVDGRLHLGSMPPLGGEFEPVGRIVLDMQQVEEGDVFLSLPTSGETRTFVEEAFLRGALGVMAAGRHIEPWAGRFTIEVEDPAWALWQLAHVARERFTGNVVAVAGSVGKSVTASLIDAVLSRSQPGLCSISSESSPAGLLGNLVRLDEKLGYGVFELHAELAGEMESLAHACRPEIAVITSLRTGLGKKAGAHPACEESAEELLGTLDDHGFAVVAGDEPAVGKLADNFAGKVYRFGREPECDFIATHVVCDGGRLSFCVDGSVVRVPVCGRHYLPAALAAWTVGKLVDVPTRELIDAIENFSPPPRRTQRIEVDGISIIDDTASRSLRSAQTALELFGELPISGRRIVVCGELAFSAEVVHECERLGDLMVAACGTDVLLVEGKDAEEIASGARRAGLASGACRTFAGAEELRTQLAELARPGDAVLLKGIATDAADAIVAHFRRGRKRAAA